LATSTAASDLTVLAERDTTVGGSIDGTSVAIDPAGFEEATGWHLEDRGLCRGDVCVPTLGRTVTTDGGAIDLNVVAELLDRPIAADAGTGAVAMGEPRSRRRTTLDDLVAPDFTLPDLAGTDQDFRQWQGRKRLLVAFASW
jgi:hypothetical protein